jgi:hypothetical protein
MSKTNTTPQAPTSATTTSVTNAASATLGDGVGGRYLFCVTGPYAQATVDKQDVTVWLTFSAPNGTPATPVAGTTGFPIPPFEIVDLTLGDGVTFKAISDTTTVNLTHSRVSDE